MATPEPSTNCLCSIVQFVGKPVCGCCINFKNLVPNMEKLKDKRNELRDRAAEINAQLRAEYLTGQIAKNEVITWLEEVERKEQDVQQFEEKVEGSKNNIVKLCLAQQVLGWIGKLADVKDNGKFLDGLVIDASPPKGMLMPIEKFFSEAASAKTCEKVRKYLTEHEFTRIGVVGRGGAGKTTIMKQIHNEMIEETADNFDKVIWVTVSNAGKGSIIKKIQDSIVKHLYPDKRDYEKYWESKDEMGRETELCAKFLQKRYLLIFDDVWETFSLHKVGVQNSSNVTIVLTTRFEEVSIEMGCKTIEVDLLTEQEAKDLFMGTIALDDNNLLPMVKDIQETVITKCTRLPLAIMTISQSMRKTEDVNAWREKLDEISSEVIKEENEGDVLEMLEFSYNLKNEVLRNCFLYCAFYPGDHDIPENELIEYWIMEGLIDKMGSREAIFDEGRRLLNELIDTCLLERAHGECVRLQNSSRDMYPKLSAPRTRFAAHSGDQNLEEFPSEIWSQEKVFLINNRIAVLPSSLHCPQLTTLILRENHFLHLIPDSIFVGMPYLEVLDLSYTQIQSLPKSISELYVLHALSAAHCDKLEYVPPLAKLMKLEELNMCGSLISEVPEGLGELFNLRNLDLFDTRNLHSFPSGDLRRLSNLQRLRIDESKVKVSAGDLLCLNKLEVVGASFQDGNELIGYLGSDECQRLKKYNLYVEFCYHYVWGNLKEIGKEVRVDMSGTVDHGLVLPNNIESLQIRGYNVEIGSSDTMPWRNTKDLRKFRLSRCDGIKFIFWTPSSSSSSENCTPLGSVEKLILEELPNLRVLFHEVAPPANFSFNLKELIIHRCSGIIKSIFPAILLENKYFPNLEKLEVTDCKNVQEIIEDEAVEVSRKTITLPNLRSLVLRYLPALESIYKGTIFSTSLDTIEVRKCRKLKTLPFSSSHTVDGQQQASSVPALRIIQGEEAWWKSLKWNDPHSTKAAFQPFFEKLI